jgi:hypothetical protein
LPLQNSIKNYDLILMGTGHHYGMPPEVVYTPAVVQLASDALTYIIRTVNKALYEQMGYTGVAVWQGYPPRHFQVGWDAYDLY